MTRVITDLTPAQKELLQRCSKDDDAYFELIALFESLTEPSSLPPKNDRLFTQNYGEFAQTFPDLLPEAFFIFDTATKKIVYRNAAFDTLLNLSEQNPLLEGDRIYEMIHPDDQPRLQFTLNDLQHSPPGTVIASLARIRHGVDEFQWSMTRNMVLSRWPSGVVHLVGGYIMDPASTEEVLELGQANQTRFLRLAESLPDTVFIFDAPTHRTLYENRPTLLGYTIDEINTPEFLAEILWIDDRPRLVHYWNVIRDYVKVDDQASPIFEIEYQMRGKNGDWEWIHQRTSIITTDQAGRVGQLLVNLMVVTQRKQTEQALMTSERQYRELLNSLPLAVSVGDAETLELLLWNQAFDQILAGNRPAGHSYDGWQQAISGEEQAIAQQRVAALRRGESVPPYEYEMTFADGTRHIIRSQPTQITFEKRPALLAITQDITPQKSMEAALRESEFRHRILSDITVDYAFQFNVHPDGQVERVWLTGRFEEITGFSSEESAARGGWLALVHPDDLPKLQEQMRRLMAAPTTISVEYRIVTKNGGVRHIWGNGLSINDPVTGRVTQIFGIGQDITERVQMQNTLIEHERFIQRITDTVPVMMMVHDVQKGRNIWVNQYASDYIDQLTELNSPRLMRLDTTIFHPDDVDRINEFFSSHQNAQDGQVYEMQMRLRRYDGVYRWFNNLVVVFDRDAHGAVKTVISVMLDINEQKEAQEALLAKQRLEVEYRKEHELNQLKNKMMQRISHEFRTPLAIILSSSYVLQRTDTQISEDKRRRHFNSIQAQIARVVAMLEDIQFIIYDEVQMYQRHLGSTYLQPLIQAVIEKAQAVHSDPREVVLQLSPALTHPVMVDERLLKLILTNLVSNALKFSSNHTPVYVEGGVEGDTLWLRVRDEGIGIPAEDIPRIFEPFYRANNFDEKPGLGIGLTIVKNAVELYDGSITVEPLAEGGSAFTVHLPMVNDPSGSSSYASVG